MKGANISFSCLAVINLLSTFLQRCSVCISLQEMSNVLCQNTAIQVLAAFTPDGFFNNNKVISIETVV